MKNQEANPEEQKEDKKEMRGEFEVSRDIAKHLIAGKGDGTEESFTMTKFEHESSVQFKTGELQIVRHFELDLKG